MLNSDGRLQTVAEGFSPSGRMLALPSENEFLTSAGFGGAAALAAAILVSLVALFAIQRASRRRQMELEQHDRQNRERRDDEQHAAAVTRCWQRLVWVVETAGIEPATSHGVTLGLGLGPELALEILRGLLRDAEHLGDDTLARAVSVYLGQFTLVLAQQGSLLDEPPDAAPSSATGARPDGHALSEAPRAAPRPVVEEWPETSRRIAAGGRRRRQ